MNGRSGEMLFGKIEMFGGVQNGMVSKWLCEREISIDARPSDALALSLRVGAPILGKLRLKPTRCEGHNPFGSTGKFP